MGNVLALGMGFACLNSAVISHLMSGGKCKIAGVEISMSLLAVSLNLLYEITSNTLDRCLSRSSWGRFSYVLKWRFSLSESGWGNTVSTLSDEEYVKFLLRSQIPCFLIPFWSDYPCVIWRILNAVTARTSVCIRHQRCGQWRNGLFRQTTISCAIF